MPSRARTTRPTIGTLPRASTIARSSPWTTARTWSRCCTARGAKRWPDVIGGTEETTTGVIRLRALQARGQAGLPHHRRQRRRIPSTCSTTATAPARARSTASSAPPTRCWPARPLWYAGYGWCSRGIAMRAHGMGANVIVTEVDPLRALEAVMDGYRVMPMLEAAPLGDIFVSATGDKNVIDRAALRAA